jgi:hypothetical protein
MGISDLIAVIALLVSLAALGMTFWFNWRQLALIDTQVEKAKAEAIERRQADVVANLVSLGNGQYRVKVVNRGKAAARNIQIEFPDGNDMILDAEIHGKFPIEVLEQHDSVDLIAAVHMQTPRRQSVLLKWADDYSDSREKNSYLML